MLRGLGGHLHDWRVFDDGERGRGASSASFDVGKMFEILTISSGKL
jgi:hypothetical protein